MLTLLNKILASFKKITFWNYILKLETIKVPFNRAMVIEAQDSKFPFTAETLKKVKHNKIIVNYTPTFHEVVDECYRMAIRDKREQFEAIQLDSPITRPMFENVIQKRMDRYSLMHEHANLIKEREAHNRNIEPCYDYLESSYDSHMAIAKSTVKNYIIEGKAKGENVQSLRILRDYLYSANDCKNFFLYNEEIRAQYIAWSRMPLNVRNPLIEQYVTKHMENIALRAEFHADVLGLSAEIKLSFWLNINYFLPW